MLRGVVKDVLAWTGGYRLIKPFCRPGIGLVLCLHRVIPKEQRSNFISYLEITPGYLEHCILFFRRMGYMTASLDEVYAMLAAGKTPERPFVSFTLDDGYRDNLTYAYPVFKKHGVPFSIAVTTGYLDGSAVNWWYLLEDLIMSREEISIEQEGKTIRFDCSGMKGKKLAYLTILGLSKSSGDNALPESVLEKYGVDARKRSAEIILGWDDIRSLSKDRLVTFMAHTVNHYSLNKLPEGKVVEEIVVSRKRIEETTGMKVSYFAYPFGTRNEVNRREFDLVKSLGFKMAFTTRDGFIHPKHREHMECLPRIGLPEGENLEMVMSGAKSALKNRFRSVITE